VKDVILYVTNTLRINAMQAREINPLESKILAEHRQDFIDALRRELFNMLPEQGMQYLITYYNPNNLNRLLDEAGSITLGLVKGLILEYCNKYNLPLIYEEWK
jgi:hypothetical protein